MAEIDDLVEEYKAKRSSMNDKEKAEKENRIWILFLEGHPPQAGDSGKHRREAVLAELLGEIGYDTHLRATLWNSREWAEPLWERILAKKLVIRTAVSLLTDAKRLGAVEDVPVPVALEAVLTEYDSRPYVNFVGQVPFKKGQPRVRAKDVLARDVVPIRQASPAPTKPPERTIHAPVKLKTRAASEPFWDHVKKEFQEYLLSEVSGMDAAQQELLMGDFFSGMRVLVDEVRNKLRREREHAHERDRASMAVTKRTVAHACATLHMDPPEDGRPIDLKQANKQKRKLAALYHPDAHEGDESMGDKYQAVFDAYGTVERYNNQLRSTRRDLGNGGESAES